jgi:transposase
MLLDGPISGELFEAYVEQVLVPDLRAGDIVVIDNLGSHKGVAVRSLIEAAGATLPYLPSCSPDFNPIEQAFSKLGAMLRKTARAPSMRSGPLSARSSRPTHQPNATTTSALHGTIQSHGIPL